MQSKEKDTDLLKKINLVEGSFASLYQLNILYSLLYIDQWDWGMDLILAECPRFYRQIWDRFLP